MRTIEEIIFTQQICSNIEDILRRIYLICFTDRRELSNRMFVKKLLTAVAIIAAQKPFNQFTHLTDFIGIDFQIVTAVIDSVFPLNETRGGVKCIVKHCISHPREMACDLFLRQRASCFNKNVFDLLSQRCGFCGIRLSQKVSAINIVIWETPCQHSVEESWIIYITGHHKDAFILGK